ncbi:MAG: ABC transporter substrate-binding protein [Solobacterium sp.]|nr:ABC transporter substrate-binding protein [Solobacterium sp.]
MFKKLISVMAVALLLVGCGSKQGENAGVNGCTVLNVYNAGEYIDEELVSSFEKEYGVRVNYSTFASNEEMYTKLLGGTVYDIIVPSDYMIEKLIGDKLIKKLDKSKLENLEYMYDGLITDYDPGLEYSVPYFWGNVGIVYDATVIDSKDVESEGWNVLKNPKYKGLIYMYDSERDSFMMALKALGYSMNTTDEAELEAAYKWLEEINDTMDPAYVTDEAIDGLITASDGKYMGMMYSGDAAYILSENENMRFFAPEEGTNMWTDAMVLHSKSTCDDLAYKFMDYMYDYDNAYANSSYVGYASPVADVLNDLSSGDGDYADNEAYLPRTGNPKDEVFHNNDDVRKIISEYWTRVKFK